jgi:hypothetical protein
MERFLLYWDDIDDLVGAVGLYAEQIRRFVLFTIATLVFLALVSGFILLALVEPPLAMAAITLLLVTLMYRSVTTSRFGRTSA